MVPSYLNPELLKGIAQLTNAKAYMATNPDGLKNILNEIDQLEKTKTHILPLEKNIDVFWPFALIATLLLAGLIFLRETRFRKIKSTYVSSL